MKSSEFPIQSAPPPAKKGKPPEGGTPNFGRNLVFVCARKIVVESDERISNPFLAKRGGLVIVRKEKNNEEKLYVRCIGSNGKHRFGGC